MKNDCARKPRVKELLFEGQCYCIVNNGISGQVHDSVLDA